MEQNGGTSYLCWFFPVASTLELLVHGNSINIRSQYKVMVISIADHDSFVTQVTTGQLPKNWRKLEAYRELQQIGSDWYNSRTSLLLKVPSAIVPMEFNYVINYKHPDFHQNVSLVRRGLFLGR